MEKADVSQEVTFYMVFFSPFYRKGFKEDLLAFIN